ncbi:hypothetical protein FJR48_00975 [Sulfurimonas lithotrophica]|uniref:Type II secretion system protein K n=1 Tax=Sulfurimonas lithotrophica TaxID=2590022 RepID=A0A5P8NY65_9BACT|nr:hypothetical protein [Sulfurimonas lithotrophica]QFR48372.1 hypothetical protein FJR48_00975 [Sulfurimonas lithotrophica]
MKKGIALLITLFFIMAITISIGIGFKYVNEAKATIKDENFLLQTNIIIDDVLTFLKNSQELKLIKDDDSGEAFDIFLAQSEFIPFEIEDIKVVISIKSARRKVNLNDLLELEVVDNQEEPKQLQQFKSFLSGYNVNLSYVDMLRDSVSKYDINYAPSTGILEAKPDIFRDYIASYEHLDEINEYYKNTYYENYLSAINFKDIFYVGKTGSKDNNTTQSDYCIDNLYMTAWTRHMLEGITLEAAQEYIPEDANDSNLSEIQGFKLCDSTESRMFLDVGLEIIQGKKTANISFEYDIKQTKGYNFSYEI